MSRLWSCEHCGHDTADAPHQCEHCEADMCSRCDSEHDESGMCPQTSPMTELLVARVRDANQRRGMG
jgi:hypothetical protein